MGSGIMEVVIGDITTVETEAIVNAANNELWMGSGVAGAIKRAGGEEIEREAMSKGPIRVGEAVATGAGRLPYKAVIHAAAMGFEGGRPIPASAETVRSATAHSLRLCAVLGIRSVVFPALGTGVRGLDVDACARAMVDAVRAHWASGVCQPERVVLVVRKVDAERAFRQVFERTTGNGARSICRFSPLGRVPRSPRIATHQVAHRLSCMFVNPDEVHHGSCFVLYRELSRSVGRGSSLRWSDGSRRGTRCPGGCVPMSSASPGYSPSGPGRSLALETGQVSHRSIT